MFGLGFLEAALKPQSFQTFHRDAGSVLDILNETL